MNNRRRRADDFTDSLRSFRQTFDTEHTLPVSEIYSEDSLDAGSIRNNALVLSNSSNNEQYISPSDAYYTAEENHDSGHSDVQLEPSHLSDETSYMSLDLNKCINLFHNKYLKKEENTSTKAAAKVSGYEKVETIIPLIDELSPESVVSSSKEDDQLAMGDQNSMNNKSTLEDIDPYELKTLLYSLEGQQKSLRDEPVQGRTLRRLSEMFYISPNDFTERLLTIIEESVIIDDSDVREFPDVSLCRLTAELRKMCKFIENETVPEWPVSPGMSTSHCAEGNAYTKLDSSRTSLGVFPSPTKDLHTATPVTSVINRHSSRSPRKIFRRTPKTISAALNNIQSPMHDITNVHDSTSTFECLEAYCKELFPDEYRPSSLQRNRLQSPLQNMSNILHMCDNQMKSLENSPSVCEPLQNVATCTPDPVTGTQNLRLEYIILTPDKRERILSIGKASMSGKQRAERNTRLDMIEPDPDETWPRLGRDDLEKTLVCEIAKKRQMCLDTAKAIMEIDGNSEPLAAQGTCSSSVNETISTEKNAKLMETLMSCKKYKEYLEEHKSLLNLLQRSESCKSRSAQSKKNVYTKKTARVNVATLAVPKSSMLRGQSSRSPSPKTFVVPKPKLFVTPGKEFVTPLNTACKKRTYFPNLGASSLHKQEKLIKTFVVSKPKLFVTPGKEFVTPLNTACKKRTYFPNLGASSLHKQEKLKQESSKKIFNSSPSTQSICRKMELNYDTVKSPVAMYIKGTNPHLIKNLRPKWDEMLLTPRRKERTLSADTKPEMKFRLSPKLPKKTLSGTPARNENVPDNLPHPKVRYKLSSQVHTIKETEYRKMGNRMNELLRSTQDKVVIRHEGRTKTVQTNCSEQPEIHYDSAEESVHIEQTARKTYFSRVQKNY